MRSHLQNSYNTYYQYLQGLGVLRMEYVKLRPLKRHAEPQLANQPWLSHCCHFHCLHRDQQLLEVRFQFLIEEVPPKIWVLEELLELQELQPRYQLHLLIVGCQSLCSGLCLKAAIEHLKGQKHRPWTRIWRVRRFGLCLELLGSQVGQEVLVLWEYACVQRTWWVEMPMEVLSIEVESLGCWNLFRTAQEMSQVFLYLNEQRL